MRASTPPPRRRLVFHIFVLRGAENADEGGAHDAYE
jgi:hypothetical protein